MTAAVAHDPRWPRIVARDGSADGHFWYSVATTGVYCRPSCPSRPANPANVAIHDTLADARRTGFRACRRCDPDGPAAGWKQAAIVERVCRLIDAAERPPTLAELAAAAGISAGHLHRLFKAATGLSPRGYAAARRADRLRGSLAGAGTVTEAYQAAGFGSGGRFYDQAGTILGMAPDRARRGAPGERLRHATGRSSLGQVLVASSDKGVVAILIGDDPLALVADLRRRFPAAELAEADADEQERVAAAVALVDGTAPVASLPLDIRGTAFQQRVWTALRAIPAGETLSYAELAARVGVPDGSRAVAGACAANAHAVAIPCHRVVRSDGTLSGYAWGVARKRSLLDRERTGRA